ncbi:MAG: VWA domain-containing protein, partial [Anaerolineales bacterium]
MSLRIKSLPGLILCFTLIAMPLAAAAQAPGEAHIHIHETPEPQQVTTTTGAVGLSLMTVFSLLDPNNQLMTSFEIQDATITVDNDKYKAEVQELETPWTVVVLADTSKNLGSFSSAAEFKFARTSLATAITGLPDNTQMALMTFASTPSTAEEFTQKKETISTAISRLRASGSGNSCLNNGLYQAVNKLSGATGRKAVIVFTASSDDCAERTPQEVVNLAQQNGVQIYGVGLKGYTITLDELKALTEPTGGLAEIRDQTGLVFGLNNIIGIFKNQWTAKATIYPSAGNKTGTLTVNLKDGTSLKSSEFTFSSTQDYIPPAEIHLKGKVQSTGDGIVFNLDLVQQEKIRQLNVTIVSKDTGQSVLSQSLTSFSDVNKLPAVSLSPGLEYTLNVAAVDNNGQVLSQDSADFKFEPPQAAVGVSSVQTPAPGQNSFEVKISATNLSGAVKYKAWLVDTEQGAKIQGTEVTVPLGDPILIPASR